MSNKIATSQQGGTASSSIASTPSPAASVGSHHQITGLQKDEIINAIISSNLDLVKRLVTPELANLKDRSGNTLLHLATNNERTTIAKWLVTLGADVNAHCNGHTVLASALNRGNFELFEYFLAHKADCIGRNQLNLVHEAVNQQRADIVNTLIGRGADPNLYNSSHVTPLSIACGHRNLEICLILIENGACANLPDKKGNTALHVACGTTDSALIECLLANTECDLRLKNAQEETPLDLLLLGYLRDNKRPSEETVRRLVRAGAQFSMPWNYTLNAANAPVFILFMAILCKLSIPTLTSLFLNDKPFFTDLITRGYWPNSLLVAIRSCMIDSHYKSTNVELNEVKTSIDVITQTGHFRLSGNDLLSTLYVCEDATGDTADQGAEDYQIFRHVRHWYASMIPLSLKILCRNELRSRLFSGSSSLATPILDDDANTAAAADLALIEQLVSNLDAVDDATRQNLVQYLSLSEFDVK